MKFKLILMRVEQCGWHEATCPNPTNTIAQDIYGRWWGFCDVHSYFVAEGVRTGGDVNVSAVDVDSEPEAKEAPPSLAPGRIYY